MDGYGRAVPLDLRQLECFIAVAEEGNIGRAATRLHMTQPPLTRRIKRLEAQIGAALFVRTPRGVDITPTGEALLEQARRITVLGERAIEITRAHHAGESGQLVAGYFGSTIFGPIPSLLAAFAAANPGVSVRVDRVPKSGQVEALRDGRIQIGFGRNYSEEADMTVVDLLEEPLYVAVSDRHRLRTRRRLRVRDLVAEPLVLFPRARPSFADQVLQLCAATGFQPRIHSEVEDAVTGLANVAVGSAVAVVPASATNITLPGVGFVPLAGAPPESLSCIHRRDDSTPVLSRLLEFLRSWEPSG